MSTMSIIVPVYNVEKWLRRCIDSILNQTFRDFELILVDDGSPDNCPSICDEYAAKDNRIKVIHQKNRGLGEARNSGLKVASGTYILFCDSDDAYVDGAFEKLMANVEKYPGADLYCFDYVEKSGRKHYPEVRLIQNKTQEERLNFCSGQLAHNMGGYAVWDKLYRRDIIEKHHISDMSRDGFGLKDDWAEDLYFNLQYFLHAEKIQTLGEAYYLLTTHENDGGGYPVNDRLEHMTVLMAHLKAYIAKWFAGTKPDEDFWKIFVWHLKRYFYLDVSANGIRQMRNLIQKSPYQDFMSEQIKKALKNWKQIQDHWQEFDGEDYRIILRYLCCGNYLQYRIENFILWRIKAK